MIANLLLYFLVTITTFGSYSSQTAIPVIGERLEADVIAILSLVLILSLIVAPIVASYMIYFQEKPLILLGLSGVFVGLVVFAFSEFYTGITFYVVAFLSLFAINAGAITFLIPSILYIFSADIEKNLRYFPYIEFAWDLGYTFGGVMPLFVSEDIYFIMYFIPIAATILISFLILLSFLKQRPKNDNFNAEITLKKVLSEKEIFMDALVIVYVVASTRSIDPIFSGLVEDQEGDEEDATYFIITGTVISFFVTSVLVVTLNYLERRFIMIFGLVCTTTGLLIVGPINYSLGGSSTCLRTSIYFLDFGMTVGTAAGLPTLYNTIKYRLRWRLDQRMIDLIVGIWVSAILLGHTIGPALMIWLTFTLEYYEAAMVFFAFGLLVAGIYWYLYRDIIRLPGLGLNQDRDSDAKNALKETDKLITRDSSDNKIE